MKMHLYLSCFWNNERHTGWRQFVYFNPRDFSLKTTVTFSIVVQESKHILFYWWKRINNPFPLKNYNIIVTAIRYKFCLLHVCESHQHFKFLVSWFVKLKRTNRNIFFCILIICDTLMQTKEELGSSCTTCTQHCQEVVNILSLTVTAVH